MSVATLLEQTRSPWFWLAVAFVCATTVVAYQLLYAALSKIPGPRITAITQLWLMYHEFKGDRTVQIDKLHSIYGPVVRVSPREVSFNNHEALKEIYGVKSDFSKDEFYDLFVYYNERNTFTSLAKADVRLDSGLSEPRR
jgi:hypothetical protein